MAASQERIATSQQPTARRGVEQRQLVGLITQRSGVRIPPPLPDVNAGTNWCRRCCFFHHTIVLQSLVDSRRLDPISEGNIDAIRQVAEFAVDLVYPKRCAGCNRRGTWLCNDCGRALPLFSAPWCDRCGVPGTYLRCKCRSTPGNLEKVRSAGPFDGWLRGAIVQFKYHGEWARAAHLGRLLAIAVEQLQPVDALIPVPLHPTRLRQRGFNQSLLLARHAGDMLTLDVVEALTRTRRTEAQVNLGAEQRKANVAGAFAARPNTSVADLSVVLVDDVVTTGSTLSACAKELIGAGAKSVKAVSLAREI